MCFSSSKPPADNSAELARQREDARVARIREGRANIDQAFAPYDDPFFQGVAKTYSDFYLPQVDDQYKDTRRKLTLNLARSGNLNASAGAGQIGKLTEAYNLQRSAFANRAQDEARTYRGQIEDARNNLYQQNQSAADPSAIAVQAASRAAGFAAPPSPSPLGALFTSLLNSSANFVAADKTGRNNTGLSLFGTPKNAQTIVS